MDVFSIVKGKIAGIHVPSSLTLLIGVAKVSSVLR